MQYIGVQVILLWHLSVGQSSVFVLCSSFPFWPSSSEEHDLELKYSLVLTNFVVFRSKSGRALCCYWGPHSPGPQPERGPGPHSVPRFQICHGTEGPVPGSQARTATAGQDLCCHGYRPIKRWVDILSNWEPRTYVVTVTPWSKGESQLTVNSLLFASILFSQYSLGRSFRKYMLVTCILHIRSGTKFGLSRIENAENQYMVHECI